MKAYFRTGKISINRKKKDLEDERAIGVGNADALFDAGTENEKHNLGENEHPEHDANNGDKHIKDNLNETIIFEVESMLAIN